MNIEKFDKIFIDFIKEISNKNNFIKKYSSAESKDLLKKKDSITLQIAAKMKQRETLLEKLMNGTITDEDYKLMANKIVKDIDKLNAELGGLTSSISNLEDQISYENKITEYIKSLKNLIKAWDNITNEEKRYILNQCIKKIYVNKSGIIKIEFI